MGTTNTNLKPSFHISGWNLSTSITEGLKMEKLTMLFTGKIKSLHWDWNLIQLRELIIEILVGRLPGKFITEKNNAIIKVK
jgi:hypothetical protein